MLRACVRVCERERERERERETQDPFFTMQSNVGSWRRWVETNIVLLSGPLTERTVLRRERNLAHTAVTPQNLAENYN